MSPVASLGLLAPNPTEPMPEPTRTQQDQSLDRESGRWVADLATTGGRYEEAVIRLHRLLLKAARFEVSRRRHSLGDRTEGLDDLATQSADDALVAILSKLETFRGESRFTTWAYKFALLEASVKMRRRAWHDREVPIEADGWARLANNEPSPAAQTESSELIAAIRDSVNSDLTDHQREVLVAATLNGVPLDVLAERLGMSRGAVYKTVHDARRKLRAHLFEVGLIPDPMAIHGGSRDD